MSDFKNKTITNKGLELLSKAISGGSIQFTKMQMGSGTFTGDLAAQESLVEVKQTLNISNIVRRGSQVEISATLKSSDIVTEFNWKEIGVFAQGADGVEILYMYGYTENSSFVSKTSLNEKLINVTVLVSNAQNVTAEINNSLIFVTKEVLDEHNKDNAAHEDIRELIKNINITWDNLQGKPSEFIPSAHTHTKSEVGLNNVDNTSDLNKPISTATQNALNDLNAKINNSIISAVDKHNKDNAAHEDIRSDIAILKSHNHDSQYLKIIGKNMIGNVTIADSSYPRVYVQRTSSKDAGALECGDNTVNIQSLNDVGNNSNRRLLSVYNSANKAKVSDAVKLHDYVGGTNKTYNIYGDHNKGTQWRISDLGLTDADFSPTNVASNMYKISYAMPNYGILMEFCSLNVYPNLFNSFVAKLKTDVGVGASNNELNFVVEKCNGTNEPNMIRLRDNQSYKEFSFIYDRAGTTDHVSKTYQTFGEGMNGMSNAYINPSNSLKFDSGDISTSCTNTSGRGETKYPVLGYVNIPHAGSARVVCTLTKTGTDISSLANHQTFVGYIYDIHSGITNPNNGSKRTVNITDTNFVGFTTGTNLTNLPNFGSVLEIHNGSFKIFNYGDLAQNRTVTYTQYFHFAHAGQYMIVGRNEASSYSTTGTTASCKFNVKIYYDVKE